MVFPLTSRVQRVCRSSRCPLDAGLAEHQPVTVMVDAVRVLTQGPGGRAAARPGAESAWSGSLAWSAAILAVFVPLAVAGYRRD
jgi:hypothetical protein